LGTAFGEISQRTKRKNFTGAEPNTFYTVKRGPRRTSVERPEGSMYRPRTKGPPEQEPVAQLEPFGCGGLRRRNGRARDNALTLKIGRGGISDRPQKKSQGLETGTQVKRRTTVKGMDAFLGMLGMLTKRNRGQTLGKCTRVASSCPQKKEGGDPAWAKSYERASS